MEHVLHFSAIQTGLAYLPWTLTVAALSLGVTARLMERLGPLRLLASGMAIVTIGMLVLAHANAHTAFFPTLFFAFMAIGLGIGNAFTPLMTIAMADVPAADAGLGSGITTLAQQVGGALGLAVLGTIATNHAKSLAAQHVSAANALVGGDQLAFTIAAVCVVVGIGLAFLILRERPAADALVAADVNSELAFELAAVEAGGELAATVEPTTPIRRRFVLPVRVAHAEPDPHDRVAA
jgi:MFS family permease